MKRLLPHDGGNALFMLVLGAILALVFEVLGGEWQAQSATLGKSFLADLHVGFLDLAVFLQEHRRSPIPTLT